MMCPYCHDTATQNRRLYHFLTARTVDHLRTHMEENGCSKDSVEHNCAWYLDTSQLYGRCVGKYGQPLNLADAWMMAQLGQDIHPGSDKQDARRPLKDALIIPVPYH